MNALNADSVLIGFNEVGSFHEFWQDFFLVRTYRDTLHVTWIDDGGDTVLYDLPQSRLNSFVDRLVEFVPYEPRFSSSTYIVIYIRSNTGEFEHYYCRVDRKSRRTEAKLLRILGSRKRLQRR